MLTPAQTQFLQDAARAAQKSGHIFPEMAACEAALESSWGASQLAKDANNLFGQKQRVHPEYGSITLPTKEFINHQWVTEEAAWVKYPDWESCFADRMRTLERLAPSYPHYAMALEAETAEDYVTNVSLSWSTDPDRASKVTSIFHAHRDLLDAALAGPPQNIDG